MASITITSDDFADLVIIFLLDKVANSDNVIPNNELFNNFIKEVGVKIKPQLIQYFLSLDSFSRVKYKRIQPSLLRDGNKQTYTIAIQNKITREKK